MPTACASWRRKGSWSTRSKAAPADARHDALERKTHCEESDPGVQTLRATLGPQPQRVLEPEPADAPDVAFYHIRLSGPITEEQRRAFVSYDVDLAAFEPPDAYRTRLTREQYGKVRATPGVRAVERYRLEETLTPELLKAIESGPERRTFDCILHRIADRERIVGELRALAGVKVLEASWLYIRFEAPTDAALLAKVAYTSGVRRLDVYEQPSLMVARARSLVGADALPWTGKGELVAVFDSGIDREHPDLHDRVKSVEHLEDATADDLYGHGTHVAGIIAGTGAASGGKIRGIAPEAKLAIIGFVDADNRPMIPMQLGRPARTRGQARRPHRQPQRRHQPARPLRLRQPRARRVRVREPRCAGGRGGRQLGRGAARAGSASTPSVRRPPPRTR